MQEAGESLLSRLDYVARRRPRLYSAQRIVLDAEPEPDAIEGHVPPGRSGVDPAAGWSEFLGLGKLHEPREYIRASRWRQTCFYGSRRWANEYMGLAAEAYLLLPGILREPFEPGPVPHVHRDSWTFSLYFGALCAAPAFGYDVYGADPYARAVPEADGLQMSFAYASRRSCPDANIDDFARSFKGVFGHAPRLVYATLRIDVFSASALMVRFLLEKQSELYGTYDGGAQRRLASVHDPRGAGDTLLDSGRAVRSISPKPLPPNDARDQWIYEQRRSGIKLVAIRELLREKSTGPDGWSEIESEQGVQLAADRYARRHGLPEPRLRAQAADTVPPA